MCRQLAIACVALFIAKCGMASPAPYIGGGVGIIVNTPYREQNTFNSFRGVPFKAFLGYGGMLNENFYLAGEIEATLATASWSANNGRLRTSYGYGVSALPGLMLSDHTLAFGRIGIESGHFSKPDRNITAQKLGLGLQTSITQNVDIRGEYDFGSFRSLKYANNSTAVFGDAVNFAVVYKFE